MLVNSKNTEKTVHMFMMGCG